MVIVLSLVAVVISITSVVYSVWKDAQETLDAGAAWRAKRRLEEALLTQLRLVKYGLRLGDQIDSPALRFLERATKDLGDALAEGRVAGLPRVLVNQSTVEAGQPQVDFLSEWTMLEEHVARKLDQLGHSLNAEKLSQSDLDPGAAVEIMGGTILGHLAPLSRRQIRRWIREPILLSHPEKSFLNAVQNEFPRF